MKPQVDDEDEFPSFFSDSDYNFNNMLTVINTMFNENEKIIDRDFILSLNKAFIMNIIDE